MSAPEWDGTGPDPFEEKIPAGLSIEEIFARVEGAPKESRADAAIADDVIDFAARLPDASIPLARLKNGLQERGVKVRDWLAIVKKQRAKLEHETKQASAERRRAARRDERPSILVTERDEFEVNAQATAALAVLPDVYQRLGSLVRVIDAKRRRPGADEPYAVTEIRPITEPLLREAFTRAASWVAMREGSSGEPVMMRTHPPDWCIKAVHDKASWAHVRPLYYVAEVPVLLPDGTIVATEGYDERMGILYRPKIVVPTVPEQPTQAEVSVAAEVLLDLVCDVPFETPETRSAWLAALLTPIARWAFTGQTPFFMFDANQSGSGKGLLLKAISNIVLGREMDLVVQTSDEDEERKRITSKILKGETMVLIDDIEKPFGSPVLDSLLTTGVWSDRLLGTNDAPTQDAWITWYGSGNNVLYRRDDTRRRCCVVRLMTELLRPEQRSNFKYTELDAHILEHRGELYAAALTVLRGWLRSGKTTADLPGWGGTWGGVNQWDRVVRGAVVFAGLPDPIATKATANASEAGNEGLVKLIDGMEEAAISLGGDGGDVRTSSILDALKENDDWRRSDKQIAVRFKKLRDAFAELSARLRPGELPNAVVFGTLLGRHKGKPVQTATGPKRLAVRVLQGENLWRVEVVPEAALPSADAAPTA